MTPAGYYVERTTQDNAHKVYGPFPSKDAAARACYFNLSVEEVDGLRRNRNIRHAFRWAQYDEGELDGVIAEPDVNGYKSVTVLPADKLVPAAYWAEAEARVPNFPNEMFMDDFRTAFNRAPEL